ncbi:MAG TPA: bifunctional diguanylate cyclase/phosphodiesterase [Iamia sp.]|nr:bifunctional diguanylate cyclase/phosphodiesterase [Iamia sp.]
METSASTPGTPTVGSALRGPGRESVRARLFSLSETAMAVVGPDRVVVDVNPALCRVMAAEPDELVGHPLLDLVQPEHRALTADWLDRCARGEAVPIQVESQVGRPGRRRWFTTDGRALTGPDGEVEAFVITIVESTTTRALSGALAAARTDMAALVEQMPVAVVRLGPDGAVTLWNPASEDMLGWLAEEVVGGPLIALPDGGRDLRERAVAGEPIEGAHVTGVDATGHPVDLRAWTTLTDAPDGDEPEVLVLFVDVTEDMAFDRALRASEHRWRTLLQNISDGVTVIGPDGRIKSTSGQVVTVLGYPTDSWVGRSFDELLHPDDVARVAPLVRQVLDEPGHPVATEARVRHVDGTWVDIWVNAVNLLDDPEVGGVVLTTRDITDQKRAESLVAGQTTILELIAGTTPLDDVLEAIAAMVEDHDPDSQVAVVLVDGPRLRPRARHGRGPAAVLRAALGEVEVTPGLHDAEGAAHGVVLARHVDDPAMSAVMRPALEAAGMQTVWWAPVVPADGDRAVAALVSFRRDRRPPSAHALRAAEIGCTLVAVALERHTAVTELAHRELHDGLTGLPNRTLLLDRLQTGLDRAQRTGAEVGVVYVDLDRFKLVNDTYGLVAGDGVLAEVADRLRRATRPDDTIARVGADEFVVVCARPGRAATVVALADRLRSALAEPFSPDRGELVLTASIGLALSAPGVDAATLVRQADAAMLRAKQRGRDRVEMYDPAMQASARERLSIAADLRRAIDRRQLRVVYQPIIELATGRIVGAEALCRWQHPERGRIAPEVFVPVAEESGAIRSIGAWVLTTALAEMGPLVRPGAGIAPEGVFELSVNLSARQLDDPALVAMVADALETHGWEPEDLCLELTETALTDDLDLASRALLALRASGVRIAVDDFGTGYSSLTHLQRLPIDVIKIDRSFVRGLGEAGSADRASIVSAVVGIATAMGLESVAEGIESEAQLTALRDLACTRGQGYRFAAPLAPHVLLKMVRDRTRFA